MRSQSYSWLVSCVLLTTLTMSLGSAISSFEVCPLKLDTPPPKEPPNIGLIGCCASGLAPGSENQAVRRQSNIDLGGSKGPDRPCSASWLSLRRDAFSYFSSLTVHIFALIFFLPTASSPYHSALAVFVLLKFSLRSLSTCSLHRTIVSFSQGGFIGLAKAVVVAFVVPFAEFSALFSCRTSL